MSAQGKLVAVRFLDKRLVKGWTFDFRPNRNVLHLKQDGAAAPTRVPIEDLKAIFFLKSQGRSRECVDKRSFGGWMGTEEKVWLEFHDGEKLAGWSNSFGSPKKGFYVFPADPDSNLEKAFVFRSSICRMERGEAAEAASLAHVNAQETPAAPSTSAGARQRVGRYRLTRADLRADGRGREEV